MKSIIEIVKEVLGTEIKVELVKKNQPKMYTNLLEVARKIRHYDNLEYNMKLKEINKPDF